jgi:hypothetical protein
MVLVQTLYWEFGGYTPYPLPRKKSLAAVHAAGDILKLVDFVLGQLGRRKDDGEFRALDRA